MDRKFKFSFPERNVQDSIVFSMVSEFKIEPSILRAAIDDDGCGVLILRLRGDDELIEKALRYAEDQDVEIDELGDHIMRDEQRCFTVRACLVIIFHYVGSRIRQWQPPQEQQSPVQAASGS